VGTPKDSVGTEICKGDIVVSVRKGGPELGVVGKVILARSIDLVGVQLGDKILPHSSCAEVLYAPPRTWCVLTREQGLEA
jgi:hypothetical protein